MADLTHSAIEAVLGTLAKVIQDEVKLIGGVHIDMKFIKDEMDSMNGFLMHLNKMESEHDDRMRAWMKQVREVSYIAEDYFDRYKRVVDRYGAGGGGGCCASTSTVAFILQHPKAYCQLRKLGEQIAELKTRVHEVSARRQRYDVTVPTDGDLKMVMVQNKLPDQDEEKRKDFVLHELEEKDVVGTPAWFRCSSAQHADAFVPAASIKSSDLKNTMRAILKDCCPPHPGGGADDAAAKAKAEAKDEDKDDKAKADVDPDEAEAFRCTRHMFLSAMYVYPYEANKGQLEKLKNGVTKTAGLPPKEARNKVMVFCYSLLSTEQKSCLQYVTAFLYESEISRTSMVRRWVAEGLVGKEAAAAAGGSGTGTGTPEEAGERCFLELLLRGFVRAARWSDAGTVKSCIMDRPVRDFLIGITQSENFIAELPAHLERQRKIRSIVQRPAASIPIRRRCNLRCCGAGCTWQLRPAASIPIRRRCNLRCCGTGCTWQLRPAASIPICRRCNLRCCGAGCTWQLDNDRGDASDEDAAAKDPMDELVDFIRGLPELYRLNVLDLGGCTGLKSRHLKSFAQIECLKYLSLRNTDVSRLNYTHINKLVLLETLDIRGTNIRPQDAVSIYLPKLKHLLAGRFIKTTATAMPAAVEKGSLVTVHMPDSIGKMRDMETLTHFQVSMDGAELQGVAKLHQLRKLGVVVHANTTTAALLGRVLYLLAANLRSLSIWVSIDAPHTSTTTTTAQQVQGGGTGILDISSMYEMASSFALENLDIEGKMSLPSWIGRATELVNVTLRDTEMDGGDALRRLATVQKLRCLKLSRKAFTEQALRFKDVQFQALKFLVVEGDAVTRIAFLAKDAAPKLEKIVWAIGGGSKIAQMYNEDLITGIEHLDSLKVIELRASFNLANLLKWTKPQATSSADPRYHIRYISSSAGNQLITEVPKSTDKTLTLPTGVIN